MHFRKFLVADLFLCAILLACSAVTAETTDTLTRSFPITAGGKLIVDTDVGSLTIAPSDGAEIRVEVERTVKRGNPEEVLKKLRLEFSPSRDSLRIRAAHRGELPWGDDRIPLWLAFKIWVPRDLDLELKTAMGSISVQGIDGEIDCNTRGGSIRVAQTKGKLSAFTSGGAIEVIDTVGPVMARTAGGNVVARFSTQPRKDVDLFTSGGNMDLYLADSLAVDVRAATGGGRVSSEFYPGIRSTVGASLREQINGGGPNVVLRSSGGHIRLRKLSEE